MSIAPRRHILSLAAQILLANGCQPLNVRVQIRGGLRGDTRLVYESDEPPPALAPLGSVEDTEMNEFLVSRLLNELERDAVIVLEHGSLPARAISMRLGLGEEVPTKLKNYLTGLSERGILKVTREGYEVTDQRFCEVAKMLRDAQQTITNGQQTTAAD